jgi:hypothetical protein
MRKPLDLILRSRPQVGFTRLAHLMSISGKPEIEGGVSKDEVKGSKA